MAPLTNIDSALKELLPDSDDGSDDAQLTGKFQTLSSMGGYLGVYESLTNPNKEELINALTDLGVKNAAENSAYTFLQVDGETTKGFIRSKDGTWREQDVSEYPTHDLEGDYHTYSKLASFLGLYDRYGLDKPNATKLRQVLVNFGVREGPDGPDMYLAPVEDSDGEEHLIGISLGEVTTAFPVDGDGHRIGDDEYTRDLLPKLVKRLANGGGNDVESFVPELPEEVSNLLENDVVAENYQLIMHRLAEQAAGDDVSAPTRQRKLAEARFITEVLTGEKTWD